MTKTWTMLAAAALAGLAPAGCSKPHHQAANADTTFTGLTINGFSTPESVLYDSVADDYLVSNINGAPTAKDNNGFISRVSPTGQILQLKFIQGDSNGVTLNAPKGTGIHGDTLFVADIDAVRLFNRATGAPLGSWPVRGATFLNDIAIGPDGGVYVTDSGLNPDFSSSGTDGIYRFNAQGHMDTLGRGKELDRPNGIWVDSAGIVVVTFGSDEVYRVGTGGSRMLLGKAPAGQLDGVFRLPNGSLLLSSWADSSIFALTPPDTVFHLVMRGFESPADIGLDSKRHRLLIPQFNDNRVQIRPLPAM